MNSTSGASVDESNPRAFAISKRFSELEHKRSERKISPGPRVNVFTLGGLITLSVYYIIEISPGDLLGANLPRKQNSLLLTYLNAPIAQLDRVSAFEAEGSRFESWWAQVFKIIYNPP